MANKRKKWTVSGVIASLIGLLCALVLCILFYGTMVYQLAGSEPASAPAIQGGLLALGQGTLRDTQTAQAEIGGEICTVTERIYQLEDGITARAVTASPAAYLERLSGEGVVLQLITGFVIDDLDAVYALEGQNALLAAREGEIVYLIEAQCDQQRLYELGAGAKRE